MKEKVEIPEKILAATLRLIESKPPSALTYREIAAEAQISHMAPYRYFKTKEEIFAHLEVAGYEILKSKLKEVLSRYPISPEKQLRETGLAYYNFAVEYPVYFQLIFKEDPVQGQGEADQVVTAAATAAFELFLTIIHNCQMTNVLSPKKDAREMAFMFWSAVQGITQLSLDLRLERAVGSIDPKKTIQRAADALIAGLQ